MRRICNFSNAVRTIWLGVRSNSAGDINTAMDVRANAKTASAPMPLLYTSHASTTTEGVVIAKSARRTARLPTRKNTIVAAAIIKNIIAAVLSISCNVNPILLAD